MNNKLLHNYKLIIISIGVLLVLISAMGNYAVGQELIRLQHRQKPNKIKTLRADFIYQLKTDDSLYYSRIIGVNDSSINILGTKYSGRDTTEFYPYYGHSRDTLVKRKIYIDDTLKISFNKLVFIKKPWFRQPGISEPFAWLFGCGVVGLAGMPVAALYKGGMYFADYLAIEAGIFAITIPIIIFFQGHTKYDMKNEWKFYHYNQFPIYD